MMTPAADYEIGCFVGVTGLTDFLFQSAAPAHDNTKVTAPDALGNVAAVRYHDDMLSVPLKAIIKAGAVVPQSGMVVQLTGIVCPTAGASVSTFAVTGNVTDVNYFYAQNVKLGSNNNGYQDFDFTAVRHIKNGLPTGYVTT